LVGGALGLHAHGHSRLTFDLDLITVAEAQKALVAFRARGMRRSTPGYSITVPIPWADST
jgi:hypothetical protein